MSDEKLEAMDERIANPQDPPAPLEGEIKDKEEPIDLIKDVPNSSGEKEESGEEVVEKLMGDLGITESKEKEGEEGEDIPDEFTSVCLDQGWTEDEIKEFASGLDNDALLELIPELLKQSETTDNKDEQKGSTKQKEEPSQSNTTVKKEAQDSAIEELKKEIASLKEELGESKKERTVKEEQALALTVNQAFDEAGEKFEIFGKTDELLRYPSGPYKGQLVPTSPAMKARSEVWEKAYPFIRDGLPIKDAMDIALTWYKGKNLEKDVERNLVKDLKKQEQKLSGKRSGKETIKVFEDEEEYKEAVVREAARKAGIKGAFGV